MTPFLKALMLTLLIGLATVGVAGAADTEIPITIENNRFSPEELKVKAGAPFVLVVTNQDQGPEECESKELRIEKVIPGGKTMKIRVRALKPGTYPFVGEYHEQTAKGRIGAEQPTGTPITATLREAFEAALLLGIVYTYLDKIGARAQA